ncbi:AgmX/PglI C-terminal domain-containing protein [Porticoccus sp. W117]|uniref:AgmX/PglI C-terminal domain-containing protein n=1 Tax=Porticoccus sp. W117 TaxID=3054777 RepID=UPI0025963152|nr:AgmX/PglI C-terminal domain-containing protein [Porticoccus sp. W117]MDM3872234.1 AgmX/PglI C-terminal domain-containing protein [Porticoccus sp. W117]
MSVHSHSPNLQLAWSGCFDIDYDFKRILRVFLIAFAVIAIAVPFIPVPEIPRAEQEILPPQLAQVVLEEQKLPEPKKEPPKPKPKPKPKKPEVQKKPEPKPEPKQKPKPEPVNRLEDARKVASQSGLLQFQDDLAALRDNLDMAQLNQNNLSRGVSAATEVKRSVINSGAAGTSGGINTANLSTDVGGAALSGRETTKVQSTAQQGVANGKRAARNSRGVAGRSDQEIRRVMDQNKGAIFAIYNRALRKAPELEGKVTVKLVIEPSGKISSATLVSSELNDKSLERKLLARIRLIAFKAASVARTTLNYSFDFLPQ